MLEAEDSKSERKLCSVYIKCVCVSDLLDVMRGWEAVGERDTIGLVSRNTANLDYTHILAQLEKE